MDGVDGNYFNFFFIDSHINLRNRKKTNVAPPAENNTRIASKPFASSLFKIQRPKKGWAAATYCRDLLLTDSVRPSRTTNLSSASDII
jgi:hypothetical protein